jgi:hypothetical protein
MHFSITVITARDKKDGNKKYQSANQISIIQINVFIN